jgi:hypothetical protein
MEKPAGLNISENEILSIIKNINKAWLQGNIEDLRKYFHQEIIMISPDFRNRMSGIETILESYKDFFSRSIIHSFAESDFHIHIFDNTAAADYYYHIVYEINGKKYGGTGREIWTLSKIKNKWLAVWRFMADVSDKEIN